MTTQNTLLNLVQSDLSRGVVLTAQANSLIFNMIPFTEVSSNTYEYNQVDELMPVGFRELGQDLGATTISPVKETELLKIMSADFITDRSLMYYQNINDVRSEQTTVATASMMDKFEKQFFYGDGTGASFRGLDIRTAGGTGKVFEGSIIGASATADAELELLDTAMDYVKSVREGTGAIIVSPKTKRALTKLMRIAGNLTSSVDLFGKSVGAYDNVPVLVSEAVKDGDIFIVNFDVSIGVSGLTCGGLQAKDMGMQGVNYRTMIEMLTAIAVKHPRAFAIIRSAK